jgi:phosphohistidine phosphatase SixA
MHKFLSQLVIGLLLLASTAPLQADEQLWSALTEGGYVVLIRHALPEMKGDPFLLTPGDCSRQRNLSAAGREQARSIGKLFEKRDIKVTEVLSSRYCRTMETARLAFGKATPWQPLDLISRLSQKQRADNINAVIKKINSFKGPGILIMVSHRPNIDVLTFEQVAPGEIVLVKTDAQGELEVIGRMRLAQPVP